VGVGHLAARRLEEFAGGAPRTGRHSEPEADTSIDVIVGVLLLDRL
jgi:hypothetical protein